MADIDKTKIISNTKTIIEIIISSLTLIIVCLFLFSPKSFNTILTDAGFEEGSVVGFKWKNKLLETDQVVKDLKQQNASLVKQNEELLTAINKSQKTNNTYNIDWLKDINDNNQNLLTKNTKLTTTAETIITENNTLLINNKNIKYGIVFSGDSNLPEALYEVTTQAKRFNLPDSKIFYRNNSYRSVSIVNDSDEAKDVLYRAKQKRSDSYLINLNTWCKNPVEKDNYIVCS